MIRCNGLRLCCGLALCFACVGGQPWFHLPETVGPLGDYTEAERESVIQNDPDIEGGSKMMATNTHFLAQLKEKGALPMLNSIARKPEEWAAAAGVTVTNATVTDVHGTKVVMTDRGLQPEVQVDYFAYWKLEDRPRKPALLVEDMVEDYRIYVGYMIPKLKPLIQAFRAKGLPVFFSNWLRRPDDRLNGALDRFYGPTGVKSLQNPDYIYAKNGSLPMKELLPTDEEVSSGRMIHSAHLSKFADVDANGDSYLKKKLEAYGVDTLVVTGAWTEDCILATMFDSVDKYNLDTVIVEDGVGTATPAHFPALAVAKAALAKVMKSDELISYLQEHGDDTSFVLPTDLAAEPVGGGWPMSVWQSKPVIILTAVSIAAAALGSMVTYAAMKRYKVEAPYGVLLSD